MAGSSEAPAMGGAAGGAGQLPSCSGTSGSVDKSHLAASGLLPAKAGGSSLGGWSGAGASCSVFLSSEEQQQGLEVAQRDAEVVGDAMEDLGGHSLEGQRAQEGQVSRSESGATWASMSLT